MNFKYFPAFIDLSGKKCLVVGGGRSAERRVTRLLLCGASVKVVSYELTEELKTLYKGGAIKYEKRGFHEKLLDDIFLVIGATNDSSINRDIIKKARKRKVLVNTVDAQEYTDFIAPSVFEQGDLTIAISTRGKSPALAAKIRSDLENVYGPEYEKFLDMMGLYREKIVKNIQDGSIREKIFRSFVNSNIISLLKSGLQEKAEERAEEIIKEISDSK